jgi:hypothetical protein
LRYELLAGFTEATLTALVVESASRNLGLTEIGPQHRVK